MPSKLSRQPVQVVIVEDHPEFRDALSSTLAQVDGVQLMEVCKDLPGGLALLQQQCPDVLLVDLGLPSGSGLQLIRSAQRRWGNRCAAAVLTVTGNEEHLHTAVAAGAKGYLFKSDQPADWVQAVCMLAMGQSPLHATLAQRFLAGMSGASGKNGSEPTACSPHDPAQKLLQYVAAGYSLVEAARQLQMTEAQAGQVLRGVYDACLEHVPDLSPRELELLQLLDRGNSFKQCAALMGVSESTTKTQAARAYEKLGATNLQTALYEARKAGLLP